MFALRFFLHETATPSFHQAPKSMRGALFAIITAAITAFGCATAKPTHDCQRFAEMEESCAMVAGTTRATSLYVCNESAHQDDWLQERQEQEVQCALNSQNCSTYQECKWQIRVQ
jgi:hypothetical protein